MKITQEDLMFEINKLDEQIDVENKSLKTDIENKHAIEQSIKYLQGKKDTFQRIYEIMFDVEPKTFRGIGKASFEQYQKDCKTKRYGLYGGKCVLLND